MLEVRYFADRAAARSFARLLRAAGAVTTAVFPWNDRWACQWWDSRPPKKEG